MNTFLNLVRFNFLFIDIYAFGRTWIYPESRLPYSIIRYIMKGKAVFFIDGEEKIVKEGDIVYLPQGCRLACHALEDEFTFYSVRFAASVQYEGGDLLMDYYGVPVVTRENTKESRGFFENMYHWIKSEEDSRMFWVRGYLDLLIGYVIHRSRQEKPGIHKRPSQDEFTLDKVKLRIRKSDVKIDPRIQVVVDYMVLHPAEQYSIKKMSQMAELSESRFRTLFKQQVGKNPLEYLNELRVMTAARKLLISGENISDIAYSLGYEDVNYFIRVFKKYFCMTPKQYRDSAKE